MASLGLRHNGRDRVSNHQPHHCLLNRLFRHRSKKTSKLRVTGLCVGNSPVTGEFPAQMASNAENVSIWWRHHVMMMPRLGYDLCITGRCVWESHRSRCISLTKDQWCGALMSFYVSLDKPFNTELCCRWFETPWRSCDFIVMMCWCGKRSSSKLNPSDLKLKIPCTSVAISLYSYTRHEHLDGGFSWCLKIWRRPSEPTFGINLPQVSCTT